MTTKREWVLQAFKNESVDKVPVGFWYHFTTDEERGDGFNPEIFNKILLVTKNLSLTLILILSKS